MNDSDKGLNVRFDPGTASPVQFAIPNGFSVTTEGLCERSSTGAVWWSISNGAWTGWARADYLAPVTSAVSTCPAANFNLFRPGVNIDSTLGDFDGDGLIDTMFFTWDGVVDHTTQWTGSIAEVQFQFGDGGLSSVLDLRPLIRDAGPELGLGFAPAHGGVAVPDRINLAGTTVDIAALKSHVSTSTSGLAHFVWTSACDPVFWNVDFNGTAGQPRGPVACDVGGGEIEMYELEGPVGGIPGNDLIYIPYTAIVDQLIPQPQITRPLGTPLC